MTLERDCIHRGVRQPGKPVTFHCRHPEVNAPCTRTGVVEGVRACETCEPPLRRPSAGYEQAAREKSEAKVAAIQEILANQIPPILPPPKKPKKKRKVASSKSALCTSRESAVRRSICGTCKFYDAAKDDCRSLCCGNSLDVEIKAESGQCPKGYWTEIASDIKWVAVMTTAPRVTPEIERTLYSLAEAGWANPVISAEPGSYIPDEWRDCVVWNDEVRYCWPNTVNAIRLGLLKDPLADAILLVQDDVLFAKHLREWCDSNLWPEPPEQIGGVSLYKSGTLPLPGDAKWHYSQPQDLPGRAGWGALCLAIPRISAEKLVANPPRPKDKKLADVNIGRFCLENELRYWHHHKSLAEHIGAESTTHRGNQGSTPLNKARTAGNWIQDARNPT